MSALSNELEKGKGEERVVKWDESNLREHELSVLRGEYGTMRIDEPKTPFAAPGSPAASDDEGLEHLYLSSRGGAADQGASASSGEGRLTLDSLVAHVPSDASLGPGWVWSCCKSPSVARKNILHRTTHFKYAKDECYS